MKLATVDSELIEREIGVLSMGDQKDVAKAFRKIYRHWAV
jgi:hypothetical protein